LKPEPPEDAGGPLHALQLVYQVVAGKSPGEASGAKSVARTKKLQGCGDPGGVQGPA
jgi:hypothetical protein